MGTFGNIGHCVVPIYEVIREPVYKINKLFFVILVFAKKNQKKNLGVVKSLSVLKMGQMS